MKSPTRAHTGGVVLAHIADKSPPSSGCAVSTTGAVSLDYLAVPTFRSRTMVPYCGALRLACALLDRRHEAEYCDVLTRHSSKPSTVISPFTN